MLFIDLYSEYISFSFKANAIFDPEKCSSVPIFFLTFEEEISIGRKKQLCWPVSVTNNTGGLYQWENGKILFQSHHRSC